MPLICLFGPDGSGKSALARELANILSSKMRVRVSWIRGTHTFASIIARFLARFNSLRGRENPYYGICIPTSFRPVWQLIEFLSALPIWVFRFLIPSILGYTVIGERSLIDLAIWISMTTRDLGFLNSFLGRAILTISTKSSLNIYVKADMVTLRKRRGREDETSFLPAQLALYDLIGIRVLSSPLIDTTDRNIKESLRELLHIISKSGMNLLSE